ncbi:hypothetical protein KEJ21_05380 [Candidatus Bathyarchaeota archaeon]|nr:hypothetical protein [Candidatus Bathyarchaeota archaeon]MBS7630845.1 hypothetical protein [Candidatus Bathyarchaeota archaeon]
MIKTLVVFLIGSYSGSKTVFNLAERMKTKGNEIILVFLKDELCLNNCPTEFADSIYLLKTDLKGEDSSQEVKSIDYSGLLDVLEKSDKVVSWT